MSKIFFIIVALVIIVTGCWIYLSVNKELVCSLSGGTVATSLCCKTTADFPNTCLIGACGCSPEYSHEVKVCDCGMDKCFNGIRCKNAK
jgi:hypothetical protein